ncbi:hypothetical protein [Caballeronia sp. AZ10_KS36]|uniref:hypothetical protein n=1 Tax=Caballeronia sp. AZ10_KS36 TaxID=2921757 RepID=UPI002027A92C|nr:hypothetical protein [Caballeronia sp. AZ10_KS36]
MGEAGVGCVAVDSACDARLRAGGVVEAIGAGELLGVGAGFACASAFVAGAGGTLAARLDVAGRDRAEAVGAARVSGATATGAETPAPVAIAASATAVDVGERGAVAFFVAVVSVGGVTVRVAATALPGADARARAAVADAAVVPAIPTALADAEAGACAEGAAAPSVEWAVGGSIAPALADADVRACAELAAVAVAVAASVDRPTLGGTVAAALPSTDVRACAELAAVAVAVAVSVARPTVGGTVAPALADAVPRACAKVPAALSVARATVGGTVAPALAAAVVRASAEVVDPDVIAALSVALADETSADRVCETTGPVAVSACNACVRSTAFGTESLSDALAAATVECACASSLDTSLPRRASAGRAASAWLCAPETRSPTDPAALTDFVGATPASCSA